MILRPAHPNDAQGMCDVLNPLIQAGGTTALRTPFTVESMTEVYVNRPTLIACTVAEEGGRILGFQSLERSSPKYAPIPLDWGIIATFARIDGNRKGVGRALFEETKAAARAAGIPSIDATIRKENTGGQIYYSKMGFIDWQDGPETVSKRFDL